jgi:cobalt-zinc-cadmium efflux system protein
VTAHHDRGHHDHGPARGLSLERGTDHAHHHLGHTHGHPHSEASLGIALLITLGFGLIEAVAGWISGSLALLSDAAHMVTDASALGLAALAARFARRPPTARLSYGLVRLEMLAALANGLLMLVLVGFIAHEAWQRFDTPHPVQGGMVLAVAALGLAVNLFIAWRLSRDASNLNVRAAMLHVMGDALGSVAALVSGAVILATGWMTIDPLLSLLVSGLILFSTWRLLSETVHALLEGVPAHIDLAQVGASLAALTDVRRVHDLHVWTLSSGTVALSAHLELESLQRWPALLAAARRVLRERHGIAHVTLQPEVGGKESGVRG